VPCAAKCKWLVIVVDSRLHSRRRRAALSLPVANNTRHDEVGVIHDCAERHGQRIPQLSALVNRPRGLGVDVAAGISSCYTPSIFPRQRTYLGNPPGTENRVIRFLRPSALRSYSPG
jgi:hypothetical protein